jgi:hypothetical protein
MYDISVGHIMPLQDPLIPYTHFPNPPFHWWLVAAEVALLQMLYMLYT